MATNGNNGGRAAGPRAVALVGPFQSGKTTLLEAILARTGAVARQGSIEAGNTVGDSSKEARHHKMSVELTAATTTFMGDPYTFLDCPGSVEFVHDMRAVLPVVDVAVVVCEMDEKKVPQLQIILRELEDQKIPRILFLNKIDKADAGVHDVLKLLQPASRTKLILRQIPTFAGELISGFVDLALERAFVYKEHAASQVVPLEGEIADREKTARFSMLETLADHDDQLMEQLLEDIQPPRDKIFDNLTHELRDGLVCPVLMGTATRTNGVLRLLKALRHELPGIAETAQRLGVQSNGDAVGYVLKTLNTSHGGRLSIVRILSGQAGDGVTISVRRRRSRPCRRRVQARRPEHREARSRHGRRDRGLRQARQGQDRRHADRGQTAACAARQGRAVSAGARDCDHGEERKDDVTLGLALNKFAEEDPSITIAHNPRRTTSCCRGQDELHLRVATERLNDRYGVAIERRQPSVGYRETIRKGVVQRGRHKKQSGGHEQLRRMVMLDIKPMPRGTSFRSRTGCRRRRSLPGNCVPFGRAPDPARSRAASASSRRSACGADRRLLTPSIRPTWRFQTAGRIGIHEGLPRCQAVLLEPIDQVEIVCPSEATAKINALLSGRRGQILGFDTRRLGRLGRVQAMMPEAEDVGDLIVEIRSATAGAGTFAFKFDHMAELTASTDMRSSPRAARRN